jgi:cellulose synthase/poly-beta-1,6-N-acetylglucosamine synthase-like glycosyltransferase
MKILFHSPILKFYPAALESWFNLDIEGIELDYYFTKYDPFNPEVDSFKNIAFKMTKAKKMVLAGNYDYLFNVDADIILQKDALKRLLSHNLDIVSGLYRLQMAHAGTEDYAIKIEEKNGNWKVPELGKDFNFGDLIKISFCPFGCLLISTKILKEYNLELTTDGDFTHQCNTFKIPMYCDTGVKCQHITVDTSRILSP